MLKKLADYPPLYSLNQMIRQTMKKPASVDILRDGVKVNGTYSSSRDVKVIGSVEGDIHVEGILTIEEEGIVNGNVYAMDIDVKGIVRGDITSRRKVLVRGTAVISGCLYTKSLEIEADAIIEGGIQMSDNEAGNPQKVAESTSAGMGRKARHTKSRIKVRAKAV